MAIINVNEKEFSELLNKGIVIVDFYEDWCMPCKSLAVELEDLVSKHPEITVLKVLCSDNPHLTEEYKIRSIPHLFIYKDGKLIIDQLGYLTMNELEEMIF